MVPSLSTWRPAWPAHDGTAEPVGAVLRRVRAAAGPGQWELVELAARSARHGTVDPPLSADLNALLGGRPWSHQAEVVRLGRRHHDVVLASGARSGRSSCMRVVATERALAVPGATVLVVVPTRAHARAHVESWGQVATGMKVAAYDSDTSGPARARIRREATVVLATPEMAHLAIVGDHERWRRFLSRLELVAIDDLDDLAGSLAVHTAHLLRRLRRVAELHDRSPSLVASAGPGGDASQWASGLWGTEVLAVSDDGAPRGVRTLAVHRAGRRRAEPRVAAAILAELARGGRRTLCRTAGRSSAETLAVAVRARLAPLGSGRVGVHRGGLLAEERRDVVQGLRSGALDVVVAAAPCFAGFEDAGVDTLVFEGIPDPLHCLGHELDRIGAGRDTLAVVVAGPGPFDRWLAEDPSRLLVGAEPREVASGDATVLDMHLECAAAELSLTHRDLRWWPRDLDDGVRRLVLAGRLQVSRSGSSDGPVALVTGTASGARYVPWRGTWDSPVRIRTVGGEAVGDVDAARAAETVHPGASYLHQGRAWRVVDLDLDRRQAVVEPDDGSTATSVRRRTGLHLGRPDSVAKVGEVQVSAGEAVLETRVTGYRRVEVHNGRLVERVPLALPARVVPGWASWWEFTPRTVARSGLDRSGVRRAMHAIEHALVAAAPVVIGSAAAQVEGHTLGPAGTSDRTVVVIRVESPARAGALVAAAPRLAEVALELVGVCGCSNGCPSCLHRPGCARSNRGLDKAAGLALLRRATCGGDPAVSRERVG